MGGFRWACEVWRGPDDMRLLKVFFQAARTAIACVIALAFGRPSNAMANWFIRRRLSGAVEEYRIYPPAQTGLLLVDAQNGFLNNEHRLSEALVATVDFARRQRYQIV